MDDEPINPADFDAPLGVCVQLDPDQFIRWQCMMMGAHFTDVHQEALSMAMEWADFIESAPSVSFELSDMVEL